MPPRGAVARRWPVLAGGGNRMPPVTGAGAVATLAPAAVASHYRPPRLRLGPARATGPPLRRRQRDAAPAPATGRRQRDAAPAGTPIRPRWPVVRDHDRTHGRIFRKKKIPAPAPVSAARSCAGPRRAPEAATGVLRRYLGQNGGSGRNGSWPSPGGLPATRNRSAAHRCAGHAQMLLSQPGGPKP